MPMKTLACSMNTYMAVIEFFVTLKHQTYIRHKKEKDFFCSALIYLVTLNKLLTFGIKKKWISFVLRSFFRNFE